MEKLLLRFLGFCLCSVLILNCCYISSQAVTLTESQFDSVLNEVQELYPDGSQQYEWKVNDLVVGWQCHGYARWLSSYVWGTDFANGLGEGWVRYDSTDTTTYIDKLVPGDVLRFRTSATSNSNHTIFVTQILGDTVYFTDCNSDGSNTIKWERTTTKAHLEELLKRQLAERDYVEYGYIAHYKENTLTPTYALYVQYNANTGYIKGSNKTVTQYTVVESDGLNLRSGAGTSNSVVTVLQTGATFTVSETTTDNKYTWGKTTYNGYTGWCVISMHWTTTAEIPVTTYYADADGNILFSKDSTPLCNIMLLGKTYKTGFVNASSLALKKDGFVFKGWGTTKGGKTIYNQYDSVTPELLYPKLKDENVYITLYAKWQSAIKTTGDISNDNKISLYDVTLLSRICAGWKVSYNEDTVDVNRDGVVDLDDVLLLSRYVAGWENITLPLK